MTKQIHIKYNCVCDNQTQIYCCVLYKPAMEKICDTCELLIVCKFQVSTSSSFRDWYIITSAFKWDYCVHKNRKKWIQNMPQRKELLLRTHSQYVNNSPFTQAIKKWNEIRPVDLKHIPIGIIFERLLKVFIPNVNSLLSWVISRQIISR